MVKNKDLLAEVAISKTIGRITPALALMFVELVNGLGKRGNFRSYSYVEDMKGEALEHLCRGWHNFDATKGQNAFAYFTRVAWAAFLRVIKREGGQSLIRDELLNAAGLRGSHGFEIDRETKEVF